QEVGVWHLAYFGELGRTSREPAPTLCRVPLRGLARESDEGRHRVYLRDKQVSLRDESWFVIEVLRLHTNDPVQRLKEKCVTDAHDRNELVDQFDSEERPAPSGCRIELTRRRRRRR